MKKIFIAFLLLISLNAQGICPSDMPMKYGESCLPCTSTNLSVPKEECEKCPELRDFWTIRSVGICGFKRSPDSTFPLISLIESYDLDVPDRNTGFSVRFLSCDELTAVFVGNCSVCPNREYKDHHCVLKTCPDGYVRSDEGSCLKCEDFNDNAGYNRLGETVSEEECLKCEGRWYDAAEKTCPKLCTDYPGNRCPFACDDMDLYGDGFGYFYGEGHTIENQESSFHRGHCWPCNESGSVHTAKTECAKCSNREYVDGVCKLKETK